MLSEKLEDLFAARLVTRPPPTARDLGAIATENWGLVAELAGVVVVERDHPGEAGHLVLSEKGQAWLRTIRST